MIIYLIVTVKQYTFNVFNYILLYGIYVRLFVTIATCSALEYEAEEEGDGHLVFVGLGNGQVQVSKILWKYYMLCVGKTKINTYFK